MKTQQNPGVMSSVHLCYEAMLSFCEKACRPCVHSLILDDEETMVYFQNHDLNKLNENWNFHKPKQVNKPKKDMSHKHFLLIFLSLIFLLEMVNGGRRRYNNYNDHDGHSHPGFGPEEMSNFHLVLLIISISIVILTISGIYHCYHHQILCFENWKK